ncbi:hypothetical protein V1478_001481 [Vespula squamosa]|uniref:Transposase n=1 Tax=Vespula squamosa TaxID=30214 RepID=A0ABD2C1L6_VESSQ
MNRELPYYRRTSTRWMIDESYVRFTRFPRKFDACRRGINLNNLHFALETSISFINKLTHSLASIIKYHKEKSNFIESVSGFNLSLKAT